MKRAVTFSAIAAVLLLGQKAAPRFTVKEELAAAATIAHALGCDCPFPSPGMVHFDGCPVSSEDVARALGRCGL